MKKVVERVEEKGEKAEKEEEKEEKEGKEEKEEKEEKKEEKFFQKGGPVDQSEVVQEVLAKNDTLIQ